MDVPKNNSYSQNPVPSGLPVSIAPVPTAIPGFIGYTERRGTPDNPIPLKKINGFEIAEPVRIHSPEEYVKIFGRSPAATIQVTISESLNPSTQRTAAQAIQVNCDIPPLHKMYYHLQLYFANGGGPCYIISTGTLAGQSIEVDALIAGIEMAASCQEITLLVCPQTEQLEEKDATSIYHAMLQQAGQLKDRFAILDCFDNNQAFRMREVVGKDFLQYGAVYHPYLKTTLPIIFEDASFRITHTIDGVAQPHKFADLPDLLKKEISGLTGKLTVELPPSSAIAGVYVKNDLSRNVWTAPADIILSEVISPTILLNEKDQAAHIADMATGKSINVIRLIPHKGNVVIGARTLAGNDRQWKFISMRRLVIMIETSIRRSIQPFVFEANDSHTWVRIQLLIENFLQMLWHRNVLQGATPDHAFFVKVGIGETMTAHDVQNGRLIIDAGIALTIPSEFLILRFELQTGIPA